MDSYLMILGYSTEINNCHFKIKVWYHGNRIFIYTFDELASGTGLYCNKLTQPIPLMICTISNIYGLSLADAGLRKVANVSTLMPQTIGHLPPNRLTTHPDGICNGTYPMKNAPRIQPRNWRLHWNSWIVVYKRIKDYNSQSFSALFDNLACLR